MARYLPATCHHGTEIDWGDFGPGHTCEQRCYRDHFARWDPDTGNPTFWPCDCFPADDPPTSEADCRECQGPGDCEQCTAEDITAWCDAIARTATTFGLLGSQAEAALLEVLGHDRDVDQ